MKNGTEAFKDGFEKAAKAYDHFLGFGKETVEAYLKAANAAGKGFETYQSEMFAFTKQSVEDSLAVTKAVLGARSVHEAIETQSGFAKTAFDTYVGEVNRLNEIALSTAKETFEPIQGRIQAWVEVVQSSRAA
jgi:phasin family protein